MKNVVRTLAVIGCITGAANECFAAGLLNLSKSQVQKVTYNDTSKGTCGLVKNKWVPVKKVTGGYKKLSNASAALKSACSSLLKTGKLKSLSDLPDVSKLGATNISAAAISAVSGTPPALVDINGPWFWLFAGIILFGSIVENMRNIALSTTVTLHLR